MRHVAVTPAVSVLLLIATASASAQVARTRTVTRPPVARDTVVASRTDATTGTQSVAASNGRDPFQPPADGLPARAVMAGAAGIGTRELSVEGAVTAILRSDDSTRSLAAYRGPNGFRMIAIGSVIDGWRVSAINPRSVTAVWIADVERAAKPTRGAKAVAAPRTATLPLTLGYATQLRPTARANTPPPAAVGASPALAALPPSSGLPYPPGISQFPTLPLPPGNATSLPPAPAPAVPSPSRP